MGPLLALQNHSLSTSRFLVVGGMAATALEAIVTDDLTLSSTSESNQILKSER
jgi:hypothetical protein